MPHPHRSLGMCPNRCFCGVFLPPSSKNVKFGCMLMDTLEKRKRNWLIEHLPSLLRKKRQIFYKALLGTLADDPLLIYLPKTF